MALDKIFKVCYYTCKLRCKTRTRRDKMSKYDQGWKRARRNLCEANRLREEVKADTKLGLGLLALGTIVYIVLLAIFGTGCATTAPLATKTASVGGHQTIHGLVRVGQMGVECEEQDALLKRVISDAIVSAGAPAPDKLGIRPLAGSSLCGVEQGVADPIGTPELGARYLAVAEVTAYWSSIGYAELQQAHAALRSLAPVASPANK